MSNEFITDNGGPHELRDERGNTVGSLPRYGVWARSARGKNEVIDTGDDLAQLQAKYAVPDARVIVLPAVRKASG